MSVRCRCSPREILDGNMLVVFVHLRDGRVNDGQWSMPARHKGSPFWAQAAKRKTIYTSSSRASRGRKFQKKKELYSEERICL